MRPRWLAITAVLVALLPLGTATADGPPPAWTAPRATGDLATFPTVNGQPGLLVLDTGGRALVLRDPRSGVERWRTPAPPGVSWHHHQLAPSLSPPAGPCALLRGGTASGEVRVGLVRLRDGALLWHAPGNGLTVGSDGTGLAITGFCSLQPVEVHSGRPRGQAALGNLVHLYRKLSLPHDTVCRDHPRLLGERAGASVVARLVSRPRDVRRQVVVEAVADRVRWTLPVDRFALSSLGLVRGTDLLHGAGDDRTVWSIDPRSGQVRWMRRFELGQSCDWGSIEPEVFSLPAGVLVHDGCRRVVLLDAATGRPRLTRSSAAAVVQAGPAKEDLRIYLARRLRFLSPSGELGPPIALPSSSDAIITAHGLVLRERSSLSLRDPGGRQIWQRPIEPGSQAGAVGELIWIRRPTRPASLLVVDARDGSERGRVDDAEWAFGQVGDWLAIGRRQPEQIAVVPISGRRTGALPPVPPADAAPQPGP
jgi:hypothetical protein